MGMNRIAFSAVLCSGLLALNGCGMFDRDDDRGRARSTQGSASTQSSARESGSTGQAAASGQSSAQTTQIQQALKAKGYDPGKIDGMMSSQTQEALRKFQKENGLQVTGKVDAQTAKALGVSSSASGSSPASRESGSSSGGSSSGSSGSSSGSRGSSSSGGSTSGESGSGSSGSGSSGSGTSGGSRSDTGS
jgi:peptidoglycan hydrolase-like protein with peptidoglycan-binding domain